MRGVTFVEHVDACVKAHTHTHTHTHSLSHTHTLGGSFRTGEELHLCVCVCCFSSEACLHTQSSDYYILYTTACTTSNVLRWRLQLLKVLISLLHTVLSVVILLVSALLILIIFKILLAMQKRHLKWFKSAHFTITYSIECSISAHISTFNTRNLQNTACNGKKTLKVLKSDCFTITYNVVYVWFLISVTRAGRYGLKYYHDNNFISIDNYHDRCQIFSLKPIFAPRESFRTQPLIFFNKINI